MLALVVAPQINEARSCISNFGGVYIPDPFTFTARVTNADTAAGKDLVVTALLPQGMLFATGETATKLIGGLAFNAWVDVHWLVRPIANLTGTDLTLRLCAQVKDGAGRTGSCCSGVKVKPGTGCTAERDLCNGI